VQLPARAVDPSAPAVCHQASFGCILKDGVDVLDYRQAEAKPWDCIAKHHGVAAGMEPKAAAEPATPHTTASAIADYVADYVARGGKALRTTKQAADAHIIPTIGKTPVGHLTRD
jgi:hypothetical protein